MQIPVKKLVRLLEPDQPLDVRCAAAMVLGEVGGRDGELSRGLLERLDDEAPPLRLQVIRAIGKLKVEPALPKLLSRIKDGGAEAEAAALAAAQLGARGAKGLHELMPKVSPGLRRYIAAALSSGGASGADAAADELLQDSDPNIIDATARSVLDQVGTLTPSRRNGLVKELTGLLTRKKGQVSPGTEAAVVRLLAALDDPKAAAAFWDRVSPSRPVETRVAALRALAKWVPSPSKEQLQRLFACAADPDFRVAGPALVMLREMNVTDKALPDWLALLRAPDVAVRRLAVDRIGSRDTAQVAEALLDQIDHPDRELRQEALARLGRLKHGRTALAQALLDAATPDQAWALARAQADTAKEAADPVRAKVFAQTWKYVEANDRRSDALLYWLREGGMAEYKERLEERALAFRKKKDYAAAVVYLRLLTRDPAAGFPMRFELAACQLKESDKALPAESRANDPALQQFANLWQTYEAELFDELNKAKWLDPEDLYYLGFHFAEQPDTRRREFGGKVLQLVVKRSKGKTAQAAKSKLKREGLGT
jgi:HEAT repeat protein